MTGINFRLIATVRQHRHHAVVISFGNERVDIQLTFSLVRLLGQYVSRMRVASLDLPGGREPHSLGRTFVCFKFRHNLFLYPLY